MTFSMVTCLKKSLFSVWIENFLSQIDNSLLKILDVINVQCAMFENWRPCRLADFEPTR